MRFILIIFLLLPIVAGAQKQNPTPHHIDNIMRSDGRIFVVVAVMLTILSGLFLFIIRIDGKIRKLEKETEPGNK